MEELISLRAVREVEATGEFDVCVVDCAPTGATLRMLRFPDALRFFMENFFEMKRRGARLVRPLMNRLHAGRLVPREEVFDAFERLYREVEDVRQILLDGDRTTARLVVNPARVVIEETRRSFAYLSLYGVATDAVIVNRELPRAAAGETIRPSTQGHSVIDTRPYGHRHKGIRSLTQGHTVIDTRCLSKTSLISTTYGSSPHHEHLLTCLTKTTTTPAVVVSFGEKKWHGRQFRK